MRRERVLRWLRKPWHLFTTMTEKRFLLLLALPISVLLSLTVAMAPLPKTSNEYGALKDWRDFALALGAAFGTVSWQARVRYVEKVEEWCSRLSVIAFDLKRETTWPIVAGAEQARVDSINECISDWGAVAADVQLLGIAFDRSLRAEVQTAIDAMVALFEGHGAGDVVGLRESASVVVRAMNRLAYDVKR